MQAADGLGYQEVERATMSHARPAKERPFEPVTN
jgi:hypothetical protein